MSDYIVYKINKCETCLDKPKSFSVRNNCLECGGAGHLKIESVDLESAIIDLLKGDTEDSILVFNLKNFLRF